MPNSLLAIKTTLFAVSTLVHAVRCSRDLPARRWRPSTAAATVGWLCYAVVFSVAVANAEGIRTSLEILAPSALWLLKLSVSLLLLHLGVRATVVWLLITYLATTWAAVVAFRLALCRPWDFETECTAPAAVWAYTGLDIVGYVLGTHVLHTPLPAFSADVLM